MAGNKNSELEQKKEENESLTAAISNMSYSEYSRLTDFITLSQDLKAKQEALDIMAADTTPSAIGASYVADTLEPNSQGDLVTLVAKTSGEQVIIDNIYRRLNIPLDKVVYSLFKNAIVIAEFAHESDVKPIEKGFGKMISAVEGVGEKSSTEDVMVKINKSKVVPKIRIISDTTRVFPILQYENVVGYIEVTTDILNEFDFTSDYVSYKDVVIHPASDYTYVKFGFRTESNPLRLRVKQEDGTIMEYDIDQGRSLLESAYPAWQTLSIMRDAVNLARLAYSASSIVVQTEVGNMTEAQIELARNKLKDLFENRLAFGKNGAKSYLQPQIKPNYIYAFTSNGVGAITTNTIGGDYNPGVLTDLQYFEDEFFGGMGAVKQHYARTCLRGNTPIRLLNGQVFTIEELANNPDEAIGKGIMSCAPDGTLVPTKIVDVIKTRKDATFKRVHLDTGSFIDLTPDHLVMMRDGTFKKVEELNPGDSLMPFNSEYRRGRLIVQDNKTGKKERQYRLVAKAMGIDPEPGYAIHHKDHIKSNDDFSNLVKMSNQEHSQHHLESNGYRLSQLGVTGRIDKIRSLSKEEVSRIFGKGIKTAWERYGHLGGMKKGYKLSEETKRRISIANTGKKRDPEKIKKAILASMKPESISKRVEAYKKWLDTEAGRKWKKEHDLKEKIRGEESRRSKIRNVRCFCCGKVFSRKFTKNELSSWYLDYLDKKEFIWCSRECLNKGSYGGKLSRSLRLLENKGFEGYEEARLSGEFGRPDTYLKLSTLAEILKKIDEYSPIVENHKVTFVEDLEVIEDAYDLSVEADTHTFAVLAGIFIHNSDSAGLDGGGAVEQYEKRYRSYVAQFKRLTAQFIKNCINNILLSRNLFGTYDNFDVKLNKAYQEDDYQEINLQQTKLGFLQSAIEFLGVEDPKKLMDIKLQALKTIITDKNFLEALSQAVLEEPTPGLDANDNGTEFDNMEDLGGTGGGGNGLMDQISTIGTPDEDLSTPTETPEGANEIGGEDVGGEEPADELPPVSDVVPESQIDEGE